ncbi:hypothetical protein GCM10022384_27020 [Streptomyces marokkonensis]|uniref:Uncharacterized protein n=1 Tax=Streptomyces marokkonensis TaxID=324855 RepID=A0ABP7Q2R3_9ACTN
MSGGPARVGVDALTGAGRQPRGTQYVSAVYRPIATADWTEYRLRATAGRLHARVGVTITVRADSEHPTTLWIGRSTAHLTERGSGRTRTGPTRHLDPAATHSVSVSVTPEAVRVVVDGEHHRTLEADWREPVEGGGRLHPQHRHRGRRRSGHAVAPVHRPGGGVTRITSAGRSLLAASEVLQAVRHRLGP